MSLPMWLNYNTASDWLRVILGVVLSFHYTEICKFSKWPLLSCGEQRGRPFSVSSEKVLVGFPVEASYTQLITLSSESQAAGRAIWQNEKGTIYSTRLLTSIISLMW